jgi:ATP-binding cassette, subfamily F, member 3
VPLLSLSRVDFDFGREGLLRDVTLDLEPGEKAALVGINGSGKSTLLQILAGTLSPDRGERHLTRRARVVVLPQETSADGEGTLLEWVKAAQEVEGVAGEIEALHDRVEAGEELAADELDRYGELQHRFESLDGWAHQSAVEATLHGLGFRDGDFDKPIRVLSGGERRRAALAAVLLQGGDLVLLDEPTNHLDLDALEWLQGFVRESRSAMLMVSHDRYFLDHVVSGVWHLAQRTLTHWPGTYSQFRVAYEERLERQETLYDRQQTEIRRTEDFIRRNLAGQKTKQAQSRRKKLEKLERLDRPREEHTKFRLRLHKAKRGGNVVLEARDLAKRFGEQKLFADLDLDVVRGDKIGIVGPNGAGKSTILKILAGRLQPDAGRVRLGSEIDLGYFDQELEFVGDAESVLEEIWRMDRTQTEEQVRAWLGAFGFGAEFVDRPVRVLSGGQRSRLGLLKIMLMHRNFLVLDEPTNHLDLDSVGVLEDALREFEGTLLVVSHDRQLLSRAVHKLLIIAGGHTRLFHGGYEEYVNALGGAPLWSEIATMEAERAARQGELVRPAAAKRASGRRAGKEAAVQPEAENPRASKNQIARLRKELGALEDEIVSLEVDLEELEQALSQAHTLRPDEIESASRQHAETKKRLQERYAVWDERSEELERMKGSM